MGWRSGWLIDSGGIINKCYCTGFVRANYMVSGGLAGQNKGTISNSYSSDTIYGNNTFVGGLVGRNGDSKSVAVIKNCYSTGKVNGYSSVGGLIGANSERSVVTNCHSTGYVNGRSTYAGGLAGLNEGDIDSCYSSGTITDSSQNTGGLVGFNYEGDISNSYSIRTVRGLICVGGVTGSNIRGSIRNWYSTGSVYGDSCIGGLSGYIESGTVSKCYSDCNVYGKIAYIGGIAGYNSSGRIQNCYSWSNLCYSGSGGDYFGGIAGSNYLGTISTSYSIGCVPSTQNSGGLVGSNNGAIDSSFWDKVSSKRNFSPGGTGLATAEMKTAATFIGAGWDFMDETANGTSDIWGINKVDNSGYPFLKWQGYLQDATVAYVKKDRAHNLRMERIGQIVISRAGIIQLVNLQGKVLRKSSFLSGNNCLELSGLPRGIFIACSGTERMHIIK